MVNLEIFMQICKTVSSSFKNYKAKIWENIANMKKIVNENFVKKNLINKIK